MATKKKSRSAPEDSVKSSASEFAADQAPEDLTADLEAAGPDGTDAPGDAPASELGPDEELRDRVRSIWLGAGGMLEVMMGPAMHHDARDVETLTTATLPLAHAFGLEWLGNWAHVIGFVGAVAAVELPKLRAVQAARQASLPAGGGQAATGTVQRPGYEFGDGPDTEAPRTSRRPAPTEGEGE